MSVGGPRWSRAAACGSAAFAIVAAGMLTPAGAAAGPSGFVVTASIPVPDINEAVAVDGAEHRVYTGSTTTGLLSVIDTGNDPQRNTVIGQLDAEAQGAVATDPRRHRAYVGANPIQVVDTAANGGAGAVVSTLPVTYYPSALAVDPISGRLYSASMDGASRPNKPGDAVTVINPSSGHTLATITVPGTVWAEGIDPVHRRLYVVSFKTPGRSSDSELSTIDLATNQLTSTIDVDPNAEAVAADPATGYVYVADQIGTVEVVDESGDAGTGTVVATVPVGGRPFSIAVDSGTGDVYVGNIDSYVSVIDESAGPANGQVVATVPLPDAVVWSVAVDRRTHEIYASAGDAVDVITPQA